MDYYITPYITPHTSKFLSINNTGLGNALFQIASIYGISKKYNYKLLYNFVKIYGDILEEKFNYNHKNTILRNVYNIYDTSINFNKTLQERCWYNKTYDTNLINDIISSTENMIITGYLEDTVYFEEYADYVKDLFSIDDASMKILYDKYSVHLNSDDKTPVSLHFRGKEYLNVSKDLYNYYNNAIEYIMNNTTNPFFLIFTDDINSFDLSQIKHNINYTIIQDIDYLELWCMSLCKHNILSISTFSWWGAYLNKYINKIVTCPNSVKQYNKYKYCIGL